jgi:protein tyrosine phosphatase
MIEEADKYLNALPMTCGTEDRNRNKNRYVHVLPCMCAVLARLSQSMSFLDDDSRVPLQQEVSEKTESFSDYINASFIRVRAPLRV